jgi:hypothetical protein
MRLRFLALPALLPAVVWLGASTAAGGPKSVKIVAACDSANHPTVQPLRRDMKRQDHVEWTEPAHKANAWMITPKDQEDWPFADTIRGDQQHSASSATPAPSAPAGHPFGYEVTIYCANGTTQHIDPIIIIGN